MTATDNMTINEAAGMAADGILETPRAPSPADEPREVPAEGATPEAPKVEAPKEEAKVEPKETPLSKVIGKKKEQPKVEDKPVTPVTEEKPIDWKTAPKEFRERHEKLLNDHKSTAQKMTEYEKRVADYENRIKEIESKSGETSKADQKLVEEYNQKISKYEETIRELDYSRSDEYTKLHKDYSDKYSQRYMKAAEDLKQFTVTVGKNEMGEPVTRTATDADLAALVQKPIAEQRRLARELFGPDADVAIRHLERLTELKDEANHTLSTKLQEARLNGETRAKEQRLAQEKERGEYQQQLDSFRKQIAEDRPDLFAEPKDDPEAAQAWKAGREFVETALTKTGSMTLQERAQHNAALEAMAQSYLLLDHNNKKLAASNESLLKELESLRGSDPGNGGGKPAAAKTEPQIGGINDMIKNANWT